jgi:hypothetical protein
VAHRRRCGILLDQVATNVTKFADHIEFVDLSGRAQVLAVLRKNYAAWLPREAASMEPAAAQRNDAASQLRSEWPRSNA